MDTVGFDVTRVVTAMGTAPLPTTARSDIRAIGRTNDCILYGGQARYVVRASDDELADLAARLPACASPDSGTPFHAIFGADAILARIIPAGSLDQIIYRVDALHWIEARGVPVMNSPGAIERSVDKFYTTALLQQAGLPTPETVVCEGVEDAMTAALA